MILLLDVQMGFTSRCIVGVMATIALVIIGYYLDKATKERERHGSDKL